MSNDTASVPGEDLRGFGIDVADQFYALIIVWAAEEWGRLGEIIFFDSLAHSLSIGRGADSPSGHRRAHAVRQRPGEHLFMPPFATSTMSADQLVGKAVVHGIEVENIGRNPMFVGGREVIRCVVEPGQLVYLAGQLLLLCVRRPIPMPPPQHMHPRYRGPFGEANQVDLVGESLAMAALFEQLCFAGANGYNCLLLGESGTGKESSARMIHATGPRAHGPFEAISAGNIPRSLLEDTLFGHVEDYPEKGLPARKGSFLSAHDGTLLFDELGRLSFDAQVALLRILDGGEFLQLGSDVRRRAVFRLIGAMNGPVTDLMLDLRKRLERWIHVPSLVDRREDIPLLVRHVLRKTHAANPDATKHLLRKQADGSEEVVPPVMFIDELLRRESFEGNVRDLKQEVAEMLFRTKPAQQGGEVKVRDDADGYDDSRGRNLVKSEVEWAVGKHPGNVSAAARELDVSRQTLYRAMARLGVMWKGEREE